MRAEKETTKAMANMAAGKPHDLTNDEVLELIRTLGDYRAMACHFADILAGTASTLLDRKSTGKSERARQASIVLHTLGSLKYETNQRGAGSSRLRSAVIDRLQAIVDGVGRGNQQPLRAGHSHSADFQCCEPCPAYGKPAERKAPVLARACEQCGHKYHVQPTVDLGNGDGVYSSNKDWCPKCGGPARVRQDSK